MHSQELLDCVVFGNQWHSFCFLCDGSILWMAAPLFFCCHPFPLYTLLQAEGEHTRARELLLQAPFLVPFTDRVRIYTVRFLLTYAICLSLLILLSATNISNLSNTLSCDAFCGLNVLEKVNPQTAVDNFLALIVTCTLPLAS